ncbi:hypothetical protein [Paenibacillus sp. HJGM_3]|uniref:hypothetical protein n=1 Tax=Paenibacillus sp. HJGM_3 TaxID=3379816 RepID=UPI00385B5F72
MTNEILQLAAVVAALVGVLKAYNVDPKHNHVAALLLSAVFVLIPDAVQDKLLTICLIGLTASGAYQYVKKRDSDPK